MPHRWPADTDYIIWDLDVPDSTGGSRWIAGWWPNRATYYPGTKVVHVDRCPVLDFKLCNLVRP